MIFFFNKVVLSKDHFILYSIWVDFKSFPSFSSGRAIANSQYGKYSLQKYLRQHTLAVVKGIRLFSIRWGLH